MWCVLVSRVEPDLSSNNEAMGANAFLKELENVPVPNILDCTLWHSNDSN